MNNPDPIRTKHHLIHIGYPRCGSTYLQRWFAAHPQFHVKGSCFAGFSDSTDVCRAAAEASSQEFSYYVTSCEALSLPFYGVGRDIVDLLQDAYSYSTPLQVLQARTCHVLADLFPGAKILIVTRSLRPVITSLYYQYVRMGYQGTLAEMCRNFVACGAADYDYAIDLYRTKFGKENSIIMPFEMLQEGEDKFTRYLEDRLCLQHEDIRIGKINESLSPIDLFWCKRLFGALGRLKPVLGEARYRRVHNRLTQRSLSGGLSTVLAACTRLTPGKRVDAPPFPDDVLELCRGKASHLRELTAYRPYLKEYLLD